MAYYYPVILLSHFITFIIYLLFIYIYIIHYIYLCMAVSVYLCTYVCIGFVYLYILASVDCRAPTVGVILNYLLTSLLSPVNYSTSLNTSTRRAPVTSWRSSVD